MKLSGWGRYPVMEARTHRPRSVDTLRELVLHEPRLIVRGNGRAYGDSAINTSATMMNNSLGQIPFLPKPVICASGKWYLIMMLFDICLLSSSTSWIFKYS